ncbi:hypothetical protein C2S51_031059 [Perilla frutescens var. frutescens]|nr:hypothetical protein C2S51_031059 [Perilla frutescens var. frutescens]
MPSRVCPWLILPPVFKEGDINYMLYDFEQDKVESHKKVRRDGVDSDQVPPDAAKLVGSSHGWLASYDENSSHVFLSNPLSGDHIKLPPINTLRDPYINSFANVPSTEFLAPPRIILSCSPGKEECRAMTSFGPGGRLAFCVPGVSTEWTPLGFEQFRESARFHEMRPHVDFVYCSRRKVFTSITPCKFELLNFYYDYNEDSDIDVFENVGLPFSQMLHWNILDPDFKFPTQDDERIIDQVMHEVSEVWEEGQYLEMLRRECIQMPHLVWAEQLSNDPLIVVRFVNRERGYTTVCFVVFKFNEEDGFSCTAVKDLNGLAIFVGVNHSFAIPATGVLKPNSIYFTDSGRLTSINGGHDCGIFDYENKTLYSFYNITSFNPLMWFTPNPN